MNSLFTLVYTALFDSLPLGVLKFDLQEFFLVVSNLPLLAMFFCGYSLEHREAPPSNWLLYTPHTL